MRMTYRIAYSLGLDAANRQMHSAGRTTWNEDDAELAARTLNLYFPLCMEHPSIEAKLCGCARCRRWRSRPSKSKAMGMDFVM